MSRREKTLVRCPACDGRGYRKLPVGGGFSLNPGNRMREVACQRCVGRGLIRAGEGGT